MDFDEENSNKILKTQPEREMTMQDEQSVDDEKKGLILQQHVQIREYYLHEEGSTGYDSRYRYKFDFVSSYAGQKKQSLNETQNIFAQVRKLANQQLLLISTVDLEWKTLKFAIIDDEKVSEIEVI